MRQQYGVTIAWMPSALHTSREKRRSESGKSTPIAPHTSNPKTADGSSATYASPGRPIAVINNVMIEYRPGPAPKPKKGK